MLKKQNKSQTNFTKRGKRMTKDKWINIRCTEQERQDITEQAKANNMSVAEFFRYLVAKEREEMCIRTPQNDEVME